MASVRQFWLFLGCTKDPDSVRRTRHQRERLLRAAAKAQAPSRRLPRNPALPLPVGLSYLQHSTTIHAGTEPHQNINCGSSRSAEPHPVGPNIGDPRAVNYGTQPLATIPPTTKAMTTHAIVTVQYVHHSALPISNAHPFVRGMGNGG